MTQPRQASATDVATPPASAARAPPASHAAAVTHAPPPPPPHAGPPPHGPTPRLRRATTAARGWPTALFAACALLLAAGCVPRPTGPILGDWRGTPPGPYVEEPKIVELVLEGAPDAVSGRYHIAITVQNTRNGAGAGTTRWQGEWTGSQQPLDGRSARIIRLQHMLDGEIDRYELAQDGTLRPATGAPGTVRSYSAAQVALYTLQPLRRDSWNYGVD